MSSCSSQDDREGRGTALEEFIHLAGNLLGRDPNRWEKLSQQVIEANVHGVHRTGMQNSVVTADVNSFDTFCLRFKHLTVKHSDPSSCSPCHVQWSAIVCAGDCAFPAAAQPVAYDHNWFGDKMKDV